jgi:hypothetical protein
VLDAVPRVRMEREAEGRLRWLTPEDAARLLAACGESRNRDLTDLVDFALFTGLRRGEVLDSTWERREVPLNSRADAVLAGADRRAAVSCSAHANGATSARLGSVL